MFQEFKTAWKNWRKTILLRRSFERHDRIWRWITALFAVLLLLAVSSRAVTLDSWRADFIPNDESKNRIVARFGFEFKDPVTAQERKQKAIEQAGLFFVHQQQVEDGVLQDIDGICEALEIAAQNPAERGEKELHDLQKQLQTQYKINISDANLRQMLANLPNRSFAGNLRQIALLIYGQKNVISYQDRDLMRNPEFKFNLVLAAENENIKISAGQFITQGKEINAVVGRHLRELYPADTNAGQVFYGAGLEILPQLLQPNITLDEKRTKRERDLAMLELVPEMIEVRADTLLVDKGRRIDEKTAAMLHAYNAQAASARCRILIGHFLLIAWIAAFVAAFWRKFLRNVPLNSSNILVAAFPLIILIFISRLALNSNPQYGGFFYFSGAVGILCVMMLDPRLAFVQIVAGATLLGLLVPGRDNFFFVLFAIFSGFAAIAFVYHVHQRRDILTAGFKIAIVNVLIFVFIHLIVNPVQFPGWLALAWVVANGLFCSAITYPTLVVCERTFGVLTDLSLLELTGVMHPALRDLEDKAPGSYQHTLNVTRLAEAAADAIGANVLLVRAGGYFHDLGKMEKPKYFSENQLSDDERGIHGGLSPHMSCLIIKNHVKDGIDLAYQYGLPQRVIDFIPQHHGTSLIKYFYIQAKNRYENSESVEPVIEDEFRYPGPKPQTIETAILMLADSVEATATSKLTGVKVKEDEIRRLVYQTVQDKFNDGQFDETPLTLRDLHNIGESFVQSLRARYHFRVAYPVERERPAGRK